MKSAQTTRKLTSKSEPKSASKAKKKTVRISRTSRILTVSNDQARWLFMDLQGLGQTLPPTQLKIHDAAASPLLQRITALGFVQLDSIKTVERAHQMILFSRDASYQQQNLQHLLESERSLFENWTHDASIIPSIYFPYWRRRFKRSAEKLYESWSVRRHPDFAKDLSQILRHIRKHGPVKSRDLTKKTEGKGSGGWWEWHPSKTALEYLWRTGKLCVAGREGFQKVYDLTDNVIPQSCRGPMSGEKQFINWSCQQALTRLGMGSSGEIAAYWDNVSAAEAASWCKAQPSTQLVSVEVEGADGSAPRKAFAHPDIESALAQVTPPPDQLRILSPFDPLIRDRKRCERLFNFHYRIEVFVPEARREYGYYVFPILEGDALTGRVDMKVLSDQDVLQVTGLWWEKGVKKSRARRQALEAELARIAKFVGVSRVRFTRRA